MVFLIADVLWWRRHGEGAPSRAGGAVVSPRYLGPTNLVLYVSVTSFIYVATDAPLASIRCVTFTAAASRRRTTASASALRVDGAPATV